MLSRLAVTKPKCQHLPISGSDSFDALKLRNCLEAGLPTIGLAPKSGGWKHFVITPTRSANPKAKAKASGEPWGEGRAHGALNRVRSLLIQISDRMRRWCLLVDAELEARRLYSGSNETLEVTHEQMIILPHTAQRQRFPNRERKESPQL